MRRALVCLCGVMMTVAGLIAGCAHGRCGGAGCPAGATFGTGSGLHGVPTGSGSTGTIPDYGSAGQDVPTYTLPGSGRSGGLGGSGSR